MSTLRINGLDYEVLSTIDPEPLNSKSKGFNAAWAEAESMEQARYWLRRSGKVFRGTIFTDGSAAVTQMPTFGGR